MSGRVDDLIGRLEAATGADRELDAAIAQAFGFQGWTEGAMWFPKQARYRTAPLPDCRAALGFPAIMRKPSWQAAAEHGGNRQPDSRNSPGLCSWAVPRPTNRPHPIIKLGRHGLDRAAVVDPDHSARVVINRHAVAAFGRQSAPAGIDPENGIE